MSDQDEELKERILDFMNTHNTKNRKPPSINLISKKIKGASTRKFYKIFPDGIKEACEAAGIQASEESINATARARKGKSKKETKHTETPKPDNYMLTDQQMQRIKTISHLEKGKQPNKIIDDLIEYDASFRREHKLDLDKLNQINEFLKAAYDRKWDDEKILDIILKLWNSGFNNQQYDGNKLSRMADVLDYVSQKYSLNEINKIIEGLLEIDFYKLESDEKDTFKNIIQNIKDNKIDSKKFLQLGQSYLGVIQIVRDYNNGKIILDEAIRRINNI